MPATAAFVPLRWRRSSRRQYAEPAARAVLVENWHQVIGRSRTGYAILLGHSVLLVTWKRSNISQIIAICQPVPLRLLHAAIWIAHDGLS